MLAARQRMADETWANLGMPMTEDVRTAFWRDTCRIDPVTYQPLDG